MRIPMQIEGFEGQRIEASLSYWSGAQLYINGEKAPKGTNRRDMLITRNDGVAIPAFWKPRMLGFDSPVLSVNGKDIEVQPRLKWYEFVWSALPIVLVFIGGALGAFLGFLAFSFNTGVFRSKMNAIVKYLVSMIISGAAGVLWLLVAMVVNSAIG